MDDRHPMDSWLDRYPPGDEALRKDRDEGRAVSGRPPRPGRMEPTSSRGLRRMEHQDELDLHGHTVEEAKRETDRFLKRSKKLGYRKVLIIHGKGKHAESQGKLRREIRAFLEHHALAGRLLEPDRRNGGHGAVWVVLR